MTEIKDVREYLKEYDGEFIPLTYDKFFKMIMKSNTDIFKEFLIRVLELDEYMRNNYIIFMDKELTCEQIKEHGKVVDINIKFGKSLIIEVEINRELFSVVKDRNSLYLEKLDISKYKVKDLYSSIKNRKIYQLNINANEEEDKTKEKSIIVEYDIVHKNIYDDRKKKFNVNLVHYYNKWYTGNEEMTYDEYLMAALYSKSYVEIYDILSNILDKTRLNKLMRGVMKMLEDDFILHEWEKEKFDKMIEKNAREYAREKGKQEGYTEGIEKGKEEGYTEGIEVNKIEMIQNMLKKNYDYNTISDITGKTIDEIKEIESKKE